MCGGDYICKAPPSACVLMIWFSWYVARWGVGVSPTAIDSAQVRLGVDKSTGCQSDRRNLWIQT